jgi:hypothetical protein
LKAADNLRANYGDMRDSVDHSDFVTSGSAAVYQRIYDAYVGPNQNPYVTAA